MELWLHAGTFGEHERGVKVAGANTSFVRVLSKLAKGQCFVKTQIYLFI